MKENTLQGNSFTALILLWPVWSIQCSYPAVHHSPLSFHWDTHLLRLTIGEPLILSCFLSLGCYHVTEGVSSFLPPITSISCIDLISSSGATYCYVNSSFYPLYSLSAIIPACLPTFLTLLQHIHLWLLIINHFHYFQRERAKRPAVFVQALHQRPLCAC